MDSNTRPLVSVLINSYNYGHFIEQAIESVLSQDFPEQQLEIVVVDDGSTDDTSERINKYGARIKNVRKENGGQASAFNAGFIHSTGELLVFLDADDFFLPGKLRRVQQAFAARPEVGMVYHKLPQLHEGKHLAPAPGFQELSGFLPADKRKLASYSAHQTSCLAFRRAVLAELMPMPETMRIQADAYLELIAVLTTPILAIPEELAVYRIHGKNLCATDVMGKDHEAARRVADSTAIVAHEVESWIARHRSRLRSADPHFLVDRLTLPVMERRFKFEPPARIEYLRFLIRRTRAQAPLQPPWVIAIKYAQAFAVFLLGYKNAHSVKVRLANKTW